MTLTFQEARDTVLRETRALSPQPGIERLAPLAAAERVLAETIHADRDYPPFARSARDGFAVQAADLPGELRVIGEVRAGEVFAGQVGPGEAVEIMTGAPLPDGADAVVMVEHTERLSEERVKIERTHVAGDNFNPRGIESPEGATLLEPGVRLGFSEIALLAMTGHVTVAVRKKPRVAILPTGDEIVEVGQQPEEFQIRNSNAWSMVAQVTRAGGEPEILGIARDNYESTRALVHKGLAEFDLLLLSGGVSAGKYDIVEKVLADFGARFFFDRVKIQPGQPLVFGTAPKPSLLGQQTLFFGLPGNPASTMVTFEVFARATVEILSGAARTPLPFLEARLEKDFAQKPGLTRFLPALLSDDGSTVEFVGWKGSGDVGAMTRANAFLVTQPDREKWSAGDRIQVLLK